jgi:hypothetical protein
VQHNYWHKAARGMTLPQNSTSVSNVREARAALDGLAHRGSRTRHAQQGAIMGTVSPDSHVDREWLVAMAIPDDQADPFNLDALAVSDRFRLVGFTRREDYLAYLWVLRALDRLRAAHVAQVCTEGQPSTAFPGSSRWRSTLELSSGITATSTGPVSPSPPISSSGTGLVRGEWMRGTTRRQRTPTAWALSSVASLGRRPGTLPCVRRCPTVVTRSMRKLSLISCSPISLTTGRMPKPPTPLSAW